MTETDTTSVDNASIPPPPPAIMADEPAASSKAKKLQKGPRPWSITSTLQKDIQHTLAAVAFDMLHRRSPTDKHNQTHFWLGSLLFWFLFVIFFLVVLVPIVPIVPILIPKFISLFTLLIEVLDVKLPIQTPILPSTLEESGRTLVEVSRVESSSNSNKGRCGTLARGTFFFFGGAFDIVDDKEISLFLCW
jgi:hypothetical protein